MNWLLVGLVGLALFLVFGLVMVFALCRAARLGDDMAARLRAGRKDRTGEEPR